VSFPDFPGAVTAARTKGKPTPTQDECDRAMLGETFLEHEPDGSDLDWRRFRQFRPDRPEQVASSPQELGDGAEVEAINGNGVRRRA
jgi:hypothetical protein